jgi:hypothetical protein
LAATPKETQMTQLNNLKTVKHNNLKMMRHAGKLVDATALTLGKQLESRLAENPQASIS